MSWIALHLLAFFSNLSVRRAMKTWPALGSWYPQIACLFTLSQVFCFLNGQLDAWWLGPLCSSGLGDIDSELRQAVIKILAAYILLGCVHQQLSMLLITNPNDLCSSVRFSFREYLAPGALRNFSARWQHNALLALLVLLHGNGLIQIQMLFPPGLPQVDGWHSMVLDILGYNLIDLFLHWLIHIW